MKYDAIVLGGGPGGYRAAERLGAEKMRVLLVEKSELGGTCLNRGCIPTKTLIHAAKLYAHARDGARFGVKAEGVSLDWRILQSWKSEVVERLRTGVAAAEKRAGVEVLLQDGQLLGPGRIRAGEEVHEADAVILATGSESILPPLPGAAGNPAVVDSTGILELEGPPNRLCVIGGGVIGVEFAGLFSASGSRVEVIEAMDEIMPVMDREQARLLRNSLPDVTFRLGCRVSDIEGSSVLYRDREGREARAEADLILVAIGRKPHVDGWGAREAGLDLSPAGITADERMRTNLPGVWAVGDVTGGALLAHAAYRMADVAVADILARRPGAEVTGFSRSVYRRDKVPWALYGMTEAAGVGWTERTAESAGIRFSKASVPLRVSGRFCAEMGFSAPGAVKILAERPSGRILGVHIVGPYASEIIWGAAALVEQEFRVRDALELALPHPTVGEAIRDALYEISR